MAARVADALRRCCGGASGPYPGAYWRAYGRRLPSSGGARRLRRGLIVASVALVVLAGGWLWLRQSPLVSVEHVQVQGLSTVRGADTGAIEAALRRAADGMSTLELNPAALRAAVASYPVVRSIQTHASFPHSLRIDVVEQPPVATLVSGGQRTAVAADGVVLGPSLLSGTLTVIIARLPEASLPIAGRAVASGALREQLALLGVAPRALASAIERVYMGRQGLTILLHGGVLPTSEMPAARTPSGCR